MTRSLPARLARRGLRTLRRAAGLNKDAVFVFGNQRSGTTVIAALLAEHARLAATLDLKGSSVEEHEAFVKEELPLKDFLRRHRHQFSVGLVKEPALTLFYDRLATTFRLERAAFVIRDPRQNIRSILNQANVPGDLEGWPDLGAVTPAWQRIVDSRWLGIPGDDYIANLAHRWNAIMDIYLERTERLTLVRYEEFQRDKAGTIWRLADELGLPHRQNIRRKVDVQYQRPGDAKVDLAAFYGATNLATIHDICGERMDRLGYR
ncbi:MAG: sulfotransferase domain-containing protein [Thermoplasmatota archaeon]